MNSRHQWKSKSRAIPRLAWVGFIGGLLLALAEILFSYGQIRSFTSLSEQFVSLNAPQGSDLYVYMSLARAVWRSPNFITYVYPYPALGETVPAVAFQLPVTIAAWIGWFTGLPLAFEILRIAGAALSGMALGYIAQIVKKAYRPGLLLIVLALGGAMLWVKTFAKMYEIAGLDGLTQPWGFVWESRERLLWWAPFLGESLAYPLECVYHAFFFAAVACLIYRRKMWALFFGVLTWASNPFTAASLYGAVLPWWLFQAATGKTPGDRRIVIVQFLSWSGTALIALAYYGPFLNQWDTFKKLGELYRIQLVPPLDIPTILLLTMPWLILFILSITTAVGRRHVWNRPIWSIFGFIVITQIALYQQGLVLGDKAMQAYHYNRGYLQFGLVMVSWRMGIIGWYSFRKSAAGEKLKHLFRQSPIVKKLTLLIGILFAGTVFFDQLFFIGFRAERHPAGVTSFDYMEVLKNLPPQKSRLDAPIVYVIMPHPPAGIVSAFTYGVAYNVEESMVVPDVRERASRLDMEMKKGAAGNVNGLGIDYAVLGIHNTDYIKALEEQGWRLIFRNDSYRLYSSR